MGGFGMLVSMLVMVLWSVSDMSVILVFGIGVC